MKNINKVLIALTLFSVAPMLAMKPNITNINAKDQQYGMTQLMFAVEGTNANIAEVNRLLAAGADPNIQSRDGYTPLMIIAFNLHIRNKPNGSEERKEIINALLRAGARKDLKDKKLTNRLLLIKIFLRKGRR